MSAEGIYVEIAMDAPMDEVWKHTQYPALHEQWDLRFTSITYLPKQTEAEPQGFLYTTQIGFGVKVSGEGESTGTRHSADGQRTSALKFWSDHPLSLIKSGSGYWKYIPQGEAIRFLTWYDYRVRFGAFGRFVDGLAFRPLLGWATAWSFDALRLWLERGVRPARSMRRTLIHVVVHVALAAIWIYQGLVPKLLFPEAGEVQILRATGLFNGLEPLLVSLFGAAEILFGLLFLVPLFGKRLHTLNVAALLILGLGVAISQPALLAAPFNPVSLTIAMIALSLVAILNSDGLPSAGNCLRRPPET